MEDFIPGRVQLGSYTYAHKCLHDEPGMKMRTIPHVNNPPFCPGMATVGFLRICGSLEKINMNPHLENSKK